MAVSKQELIGPLTEEQTGQVKRLESLIDQKLRNGYIPGDPVLVYLNNQPPARVRAELYRLYHKQGWEISFAQDRGAHLIQLS